MTDDRPSSIEFYQLMEQAKARRAAMTDEERAVEDAAQRDSFVRGLTTPCEHGMMDFEQCAACRDREEDIPLTLSFFGGAIRLAVLVGLLVAAPFWLAVALFVFWVAVMENRADD